MLFQWKDSREKHLNAHHFLPLDVTEVTPVDLTDACLELLNVVAQRLRVPHDGILSA